jgi:hypothetical protein
MPYNCRTLAVTSRALPATRALPTFTVCQVPAKEFVYTLFALHAQAFAFISSLLPHIQQSPPPKFLHPSL